MKIAIIGTGITGLSAALLLNQAHDVTLFESADRLGGHANTVRMPGHPDVDTGFIVFNERTYPNLLKLFAHLNVSPMRSDMSFGVSLGDGKYEYSSHALFAQGKNFIRPQHWRMLAEIPKFHREAKTYLADNKDDNTTTLAEFLNQRRFSNALIDHHVIPMGGCIWSTDAVKMMEFPARFYLQFLENHGLLSVSDQPQWYTVDGGSRVYVEKLAAFFAQRIVLNAPVRAVSRESSCVRVELSDGRFDKFDQVVITTHSDQALGMLTDPSQDEVAILKAMPYVTNFAVLHQDENFMPKRRKAWSSWNYLESHHGKISLTYWMNKLQPFLPFDHPLYVTLNPAFPVDAAKEITRTSYTHPLYTPQFVAAQRHLPRIQGVRKTWFAGAWCGYGFHEDGLLAGLSVAEAIGPVKRPWRVEAEKSTAAQAFKLPR